MVKHREGGTSQPTSSIELIRCPLPRAALRTSAALARPVMRMRVVLGPESALHYATMRTRTWVCGIQRQGRMHNAI